MRRSLYLAGALSPFRRRSPGARVTRSRSRSDDAPVRAYSYDNGRFDDRDRAAIGVTTSSGGMRDTLGLLVSSVTAGGPADKAGIEEGNRLVSINGVSLRLSAADAGEGDMDGIANRRLIRELEKVKAGDEVELRVWAGGQTKSVKVKTVAFEDLPSRTRSVRRELEDRPVIRHEPQRHRKSPRHARHARRSRHDGWPGRESGDHRGRSRVGDQRRQPSRRVRGCR